MWKRSTVAVLVSSAIGCSWEKAPDPPALPRAVTALAESYENPTAALDASAARTIFDQTLPARTVLTAFTGLRFLRDTVDDTTGAISENTDISIDVRGVLDAHAPCPGWVADAPADDANGFIDVSIGVEASRLRRAFAGRATDCRFSAVREAGRVDALATMELQIDLGEDLSLGELAPSLLVRATDIRVSIAGLDIDLSSFGKDEISFRFAEDDSLETLLDLATLSGGRQGTVLIAFGEDGTWRVRARDAAWVCSNGGSGPCALDER